MHQIRVLVMHHAAYVAIAKGFEPQPTARYASFCMQSGLGTLQTQGLTSLLADLAAAMLSAPEL